MEINDTDILIKKGNQRIHPRAQIKYIMIWYSISILIDMKKESRNTIIDKVAQYLHWLTIPKQEFGHMPICPYLDTEMRNDMLYIDICFTISA